MRQIALCAVAVFAALATVGCKSDLEKYSEEVCACSDAKCVTDVAAKWKDKMPKSESDPKKAEEALKNMSEKDQAALKKAIECSLKNVK